ncbi:MAG: 4Fe-4S binding protein, partial [Gammaproteobacteria bacterium]|nr:4Fe-4S binding protein [Gammaproteobacteria bacterium]
MGYWRRSMQEILGLRVAKPTAQSAELQAIYDGKRNTLSREMLEEKRDAHQYANPHLWRRRRWLTLIGINLLFMISYYFDVQLLEGALTASRFVGFHMADLNSALQVVLAYRHFDLNLIIGTATVLVLWLLLGGRSYCSWVCPYHLLAEWGEMAHQLLVQQRVIRNHTFHRGVRIALYAMFMMLTFLSGYTIFETISPTGIVSRALIYGPSLALLW